MIVVRGTARIELVQGDTLTFWLGCRKDIDKIKSCKFVCAPLGISQEMTPTVVTDPFGNQEHGFSLRQGGTVNFETGDYTYSVVITFKTGDLKTIVYQKDLVVLPTNKQGD